MADQKENQEPVLKTPVDHWAYFERRDIHRAAPHEQRTEMRRAFASGASVGYALLTPVLMEQLPSLSDADKDKLAEVIQAQMTALSEFRDWPLLDPLMPGGGRG